MEGITLGGEPVESNEYEFPVNITYGQLVANGFAAEPTSPVGVCLLPAKPLPACVDGQDVSATTSAAVGVPDCAGAVVDAAIVAVPDSGGGG